MSLNISTNTAAAKAGSYLAQNSLKTAKGIRSPRQREEVEFTHGQPGWVGREHEVAGLDQSSEWSRK